MHILIAPNAFKNSLTAGEVSLAVQKGLEKSNLSCTTECFPVGDGGDGTAELILKKFKGKRVEVEVHDPLGRKINASFGLIDMGKTAVIESADASGIRLLKLSELNPLNATSVGTGQLILAALDKGVSGIILCLGGSATVDGGAGMLAALGVRFIDEAGKLLLPHPEALSRLAGIDISRIDARISLCNITVLCDVDTYLLGLDGSAAVFGPQKGAKDADIPKLEKILQTISDLTYKETKRHMDKVKHGGAAGGLAAALYAFCNAELVAGAKQFLELTDFQQSLQKCNLVITGEGSLDKQTLQGKAPFAVSVMAKQCGIPVVGIAGRVPLECHAELNKQFDVLQCIIHEPSDLSDAIANTEANLIRTGTLLGNLISLSKNK
ncbi:glycerate kinase [Daejeonella lutea]|uniref:Glycerate kinase n=1 Tax=Daejeonella lutea TaxID=572036 RepID=A0A1T5CSJ0_9SPHI|nr:glycerate kinase [Daejeonella lutea]SKB62377.1 glycerate kinase [Daejeonella lutea]